MPYWFKGGLTVEGRSDHTVHSVDKALQLLELLMQRRTPLTLQELAAASGWPKSTVHALLGTLRRHQAVQQEPDGRYALGIRLFELGCAVSAGWDVTRLARPYLEELAARTGAGTFLAVPEGDHAITLEQCAGGGELLVVPEAGSRLPLHATAQGKLFLSQLGEAELRQLLQRLPLTAYTPHTLTDPGQLLHALETVRANGYAVEDGEYRIGLRAVAAPVSDRSGRRCAIGAIGLFRRVGSDEFQYTVEQTLLQAKALSRALSGQP